MSDIRIPVHAKMGDNCIEVTFSYDPSLVDRVRNIVGAKFVPKEKGGPLWRLPLDFQSGKSLTKVFGPDLQLDKALKQWGRTKKAKSDQLLDLITSTSAELPQLREKLPDLWEALTLGPTGAILSEEERQERLEKEGSYQTADVMFMTKCAHPVNSNQPGLGKTLEAIAAVFETGLENGPKLVVAPLTSLEVVWIEELSKWQYQDMIFCAGSKERREEAVYKAVEYLREGTPFWFVTNPATLQYQAVYVEDPVTGRRLGIEKMWLKHPQLHEIEWNVVILDEFHQMGLGNPNTLTAKALFDLKAKKRMALSGTPIGGKPIKLFGVFRFLEPQEFTSKWRFADEWLMVSDGYGGSKQIGDVKRGKEKEFDLFVSQFVVRRTKAECIPWLPPKQHVEIWADMSPAQETQYREFALLAEIKIDEEQLSATSILAEYTRLKQFSDARQRLEPIDEPPFARPFPTEDSGKLPHVEELLRERGILGGDDEVAGDEQVVIFSQFTQVVNMVVSWLQKKKVPVAKITGEVTRADRTSIVRDFQKGNGVRVLVMNTKAGGVSITLDKASTVIFLDETWVPDDQEQAEDRVHRASRLHQVTVYTIRSKGTIEEYIAKKLTKKDNVNKRILDLRREGLRAVLGGVHG